MTHLYHLSDARITKMSQVIPEYPFTLESAITFMVEARQLISRNINSTKSVQNNELLLAYNYAINNKPAEARDLLMRNPIPD